MKLIIRLISFSLVIPVQKQAVREDFSEIGRHFWWFVPFFESIIIFLISLLCIAVNKVLISPLVTAAIFIASDHLIHGLRRLDGFSDLCEGIFYKATKPGIRLEEVWQVIRSPQIGVFGASVIFIYILLQWSIVSELLRIGSREFLLTAAICAVMSKITIATAMAAPGKFRGKSLFNNMAKEVGKPIKIFLTCFTGLVLSLIFTITITQNSQYLTLLPLIFLLALLCGLIAKKFILKLLKKMNGDIIGFAWCTSEILISAAFLFIWKTSHYMAVMYNVF